MPDLFTHICVAYLISLALNIKESHHRNIIIAGSIFPDFWKIYMIFSPFIGYYTAKNFFAPLHMVLGVLISGALFISFFEKSYWRKYYMLLMIGAGSHLLLDAFLYPYGWYGWPMGDGIWFLWPLLNIEFQHGFIWPESYLPAVVSGIIVCAVILLRKYRFVNR